MKKSNTTDSSGQSGPWLMDQYKVLIVRLMKKDMIIRMNDLLFFQYQLFNFYLSKNPSLHPTSSTINAYRACSTGLILTMREFRCSNLTLSGPSTSNLLSSTVRANTMMTTLQMIRAEQMIIPMILSFFSALVRSCASERQREFFEHIFVRRMSESHQQMRSVTMRVKHESVIISITISTGVNI